MVVGGEQQGDDQDRCGVCRAVLKVGEHGEVSAGTCLCIRHCLRCVRYTWGNALGSCASGGRGSGAGGTGAGLCWPDKPGSLSPPAPCCPCGYPSKIWASPLPPPLRHRLPPPRCPPPPPPPPPVRHSPFPHPGTCHPSPPPAPWLYSRLVPDGHWNSRGELCEGVTPESLQQFPTLHPVTPSPLRPFTPSPLRPFRSDPETCKMDNKEHSSPTLILDPSVLKEVLSTGCGLPKVRQSSENGPS